MVLVKLITGSGNEREYYCNGLIKAKITTRAEMEIHLSFLLLFHFFNSSVDQMRTTEHANGR